MTDIKQWPFMGYAPGGYMCFCAKCGIQFQADKRATQCRDCIILALRAALDAAEARERQAVEAEREACAEMMDRGASRSDEEAAMFRGGSNPHTERASKASLFRSIAVAIRARGDAPAAKTGTELTQSAEVPRTAPAENAGNTTQDQTDSGERGQ